MENKKIDWFYLSNQAYRIIGIALLLATAFVILFYPEWFEKESFRYSVLGPMIWAIWSILLGMQDLKHKQGTSKLIDQILKKQ